MSKLAEAILDRRVRSPNYFQGRLLTASDLTAERNAHLARQRMLGRAIGHGIVEGLWVDEDQSAAAGEPAVKVSAGFAINAEGQLLSLEEEQSLALSAALGEEDPGAETCLFKPCDPPEIEAVPTGDGFYLLVMGPTSRFEEQAPMSSLRSDQAGPSCGRKWAVPGVRFRLQSFDPLNVPGMSDRTRDALADLVADAPDSAALSRLRNLVAHLCLGGDEIATHTADPWATASGDPLLAGYGTVDYLLGLDVLTSCDVPLALVHWSASGLEMVDCWAVRRRPIAAPLSAEWPSLAGHRLRAENEARLFQFQDHLDSLLSSEAAPSALEGGDYFRFLPAAGLLPLVTTTRTGFTAEAFFNGVPRRDPTEFINGERLRSILDLSWSHEPVDLATAEMVWLYRPWQQDEARAAGTTDRSYLIFTSAHMPPMNLARFDVARWDYSNYARCDRAGIIQGV